MNTATRRGARFGRRLAPWLVAAGAVFVAANVSCFVELDKSIACGDGYVDRDNLEQCDPGDVEDLRDVCRALERPLGIAACDPDDCTLTATIQQCAVCGDGIVDLEAGEECEGNDVGGAVCPSGVGVMRCVDCMLDDSSCFPCGDGDRDEGEECDPNDIDDLSVIRSCEDLPSLGNTGRTYAGGTYSRCRDDCRYSRIGCNFCGNGELDGPVSLDDLGNESLPEWCDGGVFDDAMIREALPKSVCYDDDGLRPIVGCAPGCRGFEERDDVSELCCIKKGEDCPLPGAGISCCFEVDNPGSSGPFCEDIYVSVDDPFPRSVCR